ncbi:uncharacterized protein LOC144627806 [Crassostrea virginica]
MIYPIWTTLNFVVCLLLFPLFLTSEHFDKHYHYHRRFSLTIFGSLTNDQEVLFSGEGNNFLTAVKQCSEFCRSDRRCIGMELCKISEDRIRCRACCKTKREDEEIPLNKTDERRYMAMYEERVNIAVNKPVTISSIYQPAFKPSHAVDDITVCSNWDLHIKSNLQFRPWIKIDFQGIYNVHSVVIYNTQSGNGGTLRNLQVNIGINGTENTCGFYEGPGELGERVVVYCPYLTRGSYALLTIMTPLGKTDILLVCEIQVFAN